MLSLPGLVPLTAKPTMALHLTEDMITAHLLMITADWNARLTLVIAQSLVVELQREESVQWIALTTAEEILGIMMIGPCDPQETQELPFAALPSGSQGILETTENLGTIVSDSIIADIQYLPQWNPGEHRRARVCRRSTTHTSVTCRHPGPRDRTGQTDRRHDHLQPICQRPPTVPQSIQLVQL